MSRGIKERACCKFASLSVDIFGKKSINQKALNLEPAFFKNLPCQRRSKKIRPSRE